MTVDTRKARAAQLAVSKTKAYGEKSAIAGRSGISTKYYSTGSATWDYMLGTGGWPGNAFSEVYSPPSMGKTSIVGAGVTVSVQQAGGLTAWIATEPDVDEDWLERLGVNLDYNVVFRPDTGEEAWTLLRELVYDRAVDYVVWDSLAGTSSAKEQNAEVPVAFGNSSMNSWGIRNVAVKAWKNQVGVMFLNQVRDVPNQKGLPILKSPGGHALEHFMKIRVQLKPGKDKYTATIDGDNIMVGREIIAVMHKNKAAEGLGKSAGFDFYHIETDEYGLGFDRAVDLLNVAKITGVVKGSAPLHHPALPGEKHQARGKAHFKEIVSEDPSILEAIQEDVYKVMKEREADAARRKRERKQGRPTRSKAKKEEDNG